MCVGRGSGGSGGDGGQIFRKIITNSRLYLVII